MKPRLTALAFAIALGFGAPAYADDSRSEITQIGDSNSAGIQQQDSPTASASVLQIGDLNGGVFASLPTILQFQAAGSTAVVEQTGDSNRGYVEQLFGSALYGAVRQVGDGNKAFTAQAVGSANTALVYQGGTGCLGTGNPCAEFEQFVLGSSVSNSASVIQTNGSGNTGIVLQGGTGHVAEVGQFQGDNNFARVIQFGSGHNARLQQGGTVCQGEICVTGASEAGLILAFQAGVDNNLEVVQLGANNLVSAFQNGIGGGNSASVDQSGNGLRAFLFQAGTANNASIYQR